MRFFFIGPRILGIRPGISFGVNELLNRKPAEPITGSFLYVIRGDHNMSKVGVTTNPSARLASLRTGSAFPIDYSYIAVCVPAPRRLRAALRASPWPVMLPSSSAAVHPVAVCPGWRQGCVKRVLAAGEAQADVARSYAVSQATNLPAGPWPFRRGRRRRAL